MIIRNVNIVNESRQFVGSVFIENDTIREIAVGGQGFRAPEAAADENILDGSGLFLLPGVIDEHVHFREPGLTQKADIESESRAAAAGGVTAYFDMPNCIPQTTSLEAWEEKAARAAEKSLVNYAFYFGATNENAHLFPLLDKKRTPAIKLFMGASTGNMLVDKETALRRIFAETPLPIMAHCEDSAMISHNMKTAQEKYGSDPDICLHPLIRSEAACLASSLTAAQLAETYGTRLIITHISTKKELEMLRGRHEIHLEACLPHLLFDERDYAVLGSRIKCNPAVKTTADRDALRLALSDGTVSTVATDHAPHLLKEKIGGAAKAVSGMPMLQFSLTAMLELVSEGVLTMERVVELMSHMPARLFGVSRRGFVREGYKADLVLVRPNTLWTVSAQDVVSKCGWSPLEGRTFRWKVETTICNGHIVYDKGNFFPHPAEQVIFER